MSATQKSQHFTKSMPALENGSSVSMKPSGKENLSETINISKLAISASSTQSKHSLKILNCRVSRVNSWLPSIRTTSCPILLRVYGRLLSISDLPSNKLKDVDVIISKVIVVSDISDPSQRITCVFHEIDRSLDSFSIGDNIVVAGQSRRMMKEFDLHIVSVEEFNLQDTMPYLPRIENFALRSLKTILNP